jgi:hypothetical protein
MGELLETRRIRTEERFSEMRSRLVAAEDRCKGKACVYATGSFGRGEASRFSDLDLFIVGTPTVGNGKEERALSRLDEICVKADLIQVTRNLDIPDFSGDGEYLEHYTTEKLIKTLGMPDDDSSNTFTARLLLLLESQPLIEASVYHVVTTEVIVAYWRDYKDHRDEFMPAYLANDILRLWRTFCVNYEARTATEPAAKKAKRKLKNYKLKHSRLLTCYSALLYLLAIYADRNTVSPDDADAMIRLTPMARLNWLAQQERLSKIKGTITQLVDQYEQFLAQTEASEEDLVEVFMDKTRSRTFMESASALGNSVFELLRLIGGETRFYRLLVV